MTHPSPRAIMVDDLYALKNIVDVQLSPCGTRIAFTVVAIDREADDYRSTIWVIAADGSGLESFTRGAGKDAAPRWSPDGRWLAFLSDRFSRSPQLFVMPVRGGEARQLTTLERGAGAPVWSPDSTTLLFPACVPREQGPADPEARRRWERRPRVVTRAHYKDDGLGYTFDSVSQLFTVDLQGGTPVQITHGTSAHRAPCWAPDGRRIACSRCRDGVGDYYVTDIWVMDADGSGAWRLTEDIGRATSPCWSPDGSAVACYGTARQDSTLGDPVVHVWVVPAGQGRPVQVTRDLDRGVMLHPRHLTTPPAIWSGDGTSLTFSVADAGNVHLVRTWLSDPRTTRIVGGDRHVVAYSASPPADRIAFVSSELFDPADLWVCDWAGTGQRRLTRVNESVTAGWLLPRVERRTFPGPHGGELDGWVWRPAVGDGSLPMLLDIHGGPHAFFGNVFVHGHFYRYVLACRGWAVLTLNSTGSGSYGSAFAGAIRGRWGEYDLPEQLAAVDALVAEGLADGRRLAITGYSYGGFMTAWTIAHTDRFRAAVVGGPVVDLDSFHGTSDIGWCFGAWELGGDVASNRERYGRLSPINLVERIVTPTLVVHGEADDRCPIGQGEELFVGLIAAGKAPAEMVRYPGSAHLFNVGGLPSHRVDYCRRTIDWVERHTLGGR